MGAACTAVELMVNILCSFALQHSISEEERAARCAARVLSAAAHGAGGK